MRELNAMLAIAHRDLLKFLRDRPRLITTLVFPFVIIAALGGSLDASFGSSLGYSFIAFTMTGVFAQTLFQSSAMGVVSLIEDRQNDFSQEIFVSPISRYSIIFGKIAGESLVSLALGVGILLFGFVLGIRPTPEQALLLVPVAVASCLFGGAFGIAVLGTVSTQRAATQIFPFVMLPQYFLAGVFNPINAMPPAMDVISHLTPMRYPVDLTRGAFYTGRPEYGRVVLDSPILNLGVMAVLFVLFLLIGTYLFVRAERNR